MKETSLNFGAIKETVVKIASNEILQENFKKATLSKFKKALQETSIFKKQYLVFKNFEDCKPFSKESLAERFINQNMKLFKGENWNNILNENKRIRLDILGESHVEANPEKFELFENIHTIIEATTKPDYFNVIKEQEAYDFLINYLTRDAIQEGTVSEETQENPEFGWDFITKIAVSNFNKRYAHLTESEQDILGKLLSDYENKKNYLQVFLQLLVKSFKK